jgi:hypothetical protein
MSYLKSVVSSGIARERERERERESERERERNQANRELKNFTVS